MGALRHCDVDAKVDKGLEKKTFVRPLYNFQDLFRRIWRDWPIVPFARVECSYWESELKFAKRFVLRADCV